MANERMSGAERPEREEPDQPEPERDPQREPWHDPGPPVRKVNLPPDNPSRGVPVEDPNRPNR